MMFIAPTAAILFIPAMLAMADDAGDCTPATNPFDPDWPAHFQTASDTAPLAMEDETIPFEKLRTMPEGAQSITFNAWVKDESTGKLRKERRTIDDPVIVVTWDNAFGEKPFNQHRPLEEYVANPLDGNLWFTIHCNIYERLDAMGYDRSCLNVTRAAAACNDAIALGAPAVGLPFSFTAMDGSGKYDPFDLDATWWRESVVVAIADRSSMVRPSLNPTVATSTDQNYTDNGRPILDKQSGMYRRPEQGDAIYPAVQEKLADFVGYIAECPGSLPRYRTYTGPDGYWDWLYRWTLNSWEGPHSPTTLKPCPNQNPPYDLYPYSGLGLTLDWTVDPADGGDPKDIADDFYALSEFIQNGESSIYFIGIWQGSQYLGTPEKGQLPWYESCTYDYDMDGIVSGDDLTILLGYWSEIPDEETNLCLNKNKIAPVVDGEVLVELLNNWGACPSWPIPQVMPTCPPTP